jgi:selenocysteine lyase/cysteine desulfurase
MATSAATGTSLMEAAYAGFLSPYPDYRKIAALAQLRATEYRRRLEEWAGQEGISLRTGCFCNPGAGEIAEGLTEEDMTAALAQGPDINLVRFVRMMRHRSDKSAGAVRASIELATNFADV